MAKDTAAVERIRDELERAFDKTRADLDRVEILATGLAAFNMPVPTYEPRFRHLPRLGLTAHELPSD